MFSSPRYIHKFLTMFKETMFRLTKLRVVSIENDEGARNEGGSPNEVGVGKTQNGLLLCYLRSV